MENIGNFRSRLNTLPIDLKMKIGEVVFQEGMLPTHRRDMVIGHLEKSGIQFNNSGTGTNRHIIKYDGYAVKIALDIEGIADNRQEFAVCDALSPHVAYSHEISKGGHLLVASYCPAFTSYSEMYSYSHTIKNILSDWSKRHLLGDVGLTKKTFANWGLDPSGKPVCIDYAYLFPASLDLFMCFCGSKDIQFTDYTYSAYKCQKCNYEYKDQDLRMKVATTQERIRLFENVKGIIMREAYEQHPIESRYVLAETNPDAPDLYQSALNMTARYGHLASSY